MLMRNFRLKRDKHPLQTMVSDVDVQSALKKSHNAMTTSNRSYIPQNPTILQDGARHFLILNYHLVKMHRKEEECIVQVQQ